MAVSSVFESVWSDLQGVPCSQGYLDAGGVRTRYLHAGDTSKPTLVLLHGSGGHAEAYVRNLESHAEHFSTWSIDMLGHGYTDKPGHPLEIAHYLDHLLAFFDAIGVDRVHLSGESLGGWVAARAASDHPDRIERLVLNTAGGSQADPEVMKRIITLSMAAVEDPTWETVQARIKWLMADKSKDYDDIVASRQRIYRQPGFVAAMSDIMALQDPEIRARNLLWPDGLRRDHRADPGAVDQRRPDRRRQRGQPHRVDDPRRALRGDGRLRALAAVRGRQDVQRLAHRLPAGPREMEPRRGRPDRRRGAGRAHAGEYPWSAGCSDARRRRARLADRLSRAASGSTTRRCARSSRSALVGARAAAHRAQPDPAVLRRQAAPARRDGPARRAIRLAQAQRVRPADGRRRTAPRARALRLRRRALECQRWNPATRPPTVSPSTSPDGPIRHRPLRRRLRRRAQCDAAADGRDVRGHHRPRRAGWSSTSRPIRSGTPTARSAPTPSGRTRRSRSPTEFGASSS